MKNLNSVCEWAAAITRMNGMKAKCFIPYPQSAGNDGPRLNSKGLTWEPVWSTCVRARMATMQIGMGRKKHGQPMIDQRRMWRTEGIVGLTWEEALSKGRSASMATMRRRMRRDKHRQRIMDYCRMWGSEGIVLESVKIGLYISNL
jgi:hypothetical protein